MTKKWLFVGSKTRYDRNPGQGIYICQFDSSTGALTFVETFTDIVDPTFLLTTRDGRFLYSVIEVDDFMTEKTGAVAAFSVHPQTAKLTLLNCRATGGASPCHLCLDQQEKVIFVSNYNGGSVAAFSIAADGSLEERTQLLEYHGFSIVRPNQQQAHAHAAVISPDNRYVFVADLGTDNIHQYKLHLNTHTITENFPSANLKAGAGPRHFAFHPTLPIVYVINELDSTVAIFDYHQEGGYLIQKQVIDNLPKGFAGQNSAADIHLTHNGKFLYASNRGHDSLAIFAVNAQTGELTSLGYQPTLGEHPRNFLITPDDNWLLCANRNTDNVVVFKLHAETGMLTNVGNYPLNKPICLHLSSLDAPTK